MLEWVECFAPGDETEIAKVRDRERTGRVKWVERGRKRDEGKTKREIPEAEVYHAG